jgi:hypothetical protein
MRRPPSSGREQTVTGGVGQCQLRDDRHVAGAYRTEPDRSAGTDIPSAGPYERIGP